MKVQTCNARLMFTFVIRNDLPMTNIRNDCVMKDLAYRSVQGTAVWAGVWRPGTGRTLAPLPQPAHQKEMSSSFIHISRGRWNNRLKICSVLDPDPDSIRSVDSDPVVQKRPTKIKLRNFMFWSAGFSLLRAKSFSCNLDVLHGRSKLQYLIKQRKIYIYKFFVIFKDANKKLI